MRRGFALTLSMVILIFFLSLILSVESQRIAIEEQTRANHAQMRALTSLVADIDTPALDYSIAKMAKRSLYEIDWNVITTHQPSKDPERELKDSFTQKFNGYLTSLEKRANDSGLTLTHTTPEVIITQRDPFTFTVNVSTNLTFRGKDVYVNKTLKKSINFSIEGIYDPLLSLKTYDKNLDVPTNSILLPIIKSKINEFDDLTPIARGYGRGWVYGEVIDPENADKLQPQEWSGYILQLEGKDLPMWKDNLTQFKGVILISDKMANPNEIQTDVPGYTSDGAACTLTIRATIWSETTAPCIMCGTYIIHKVISRSNESCVPSYASEYHYPDGVSDTYYLYSKANIVNDPDSLQGRKNIDIGNTPFIVTSSSINAKKVLINSEIENSLEDTINLAYPPVHDVSIYNIEKQRAAVLCANYFTFGRGTNITNRLKGNVNKNDPNGIETFVIGPDWAKQDYSKHDYEYFNKINGNLMKGMPGCITPQMCNTPTKDLQIGHFMISTDREDDYKMKPLEVEK